MLKDQSKLPRTSNARRTAKKSTNAAIEAAINKYGDKASLSAAWCAFAARCEGKEEDYRFWLNAFKSLAGKQPRDSEALPTDAEENPLLEFAFERRM